MQFCYADAPQSVYLLTCAWTLGLLPPPATVNSAAVRPILDISVMDISKYAISKPHRKWQGNLALRTQQQVASERKRTLGRVGLDPGALFSEEGGHKQNQAWRRRRSQTLAYFSPNDTSYLSETNGLTPAGLGGLSEVVIKRKRCQILKGDAFQWLCSREVH